MPDGAAPFTLVRLEGGLSGQNWVLPSSAQALQVGKMGTTPVGGAHLAHPGPSEPAGLDFETVSSEPFTTKDDKPGYKAWARGFHPARGGWVRLVQLWWGPGPHEHIVVDLRRPGQLGWVEPVLRWLVDGGARLVAHNAVYEQLYLRAAGVRVPVSCTMLLDSAMRAAATGHHDANSTTEFNTTRHRGLDDLALDVLKDGKAGDHQSSDWSGELTQEQLGYAVRDAELSARLWPVLIEQVPEEARPGVELLMQATGPTAQVNLTGLYADDDAHQRLIEELEVEVGEREAQLIDPAIENPRSAKQVSELVEQAIGRAGLIALGWPRTNTGQLNLRRPVVERMLHGLHELHPALADWLGRRIAWRNVGKLTEAFGEGMRQWRYPDGRYRSELRLMGAVTGRMSAAHPNVQQIPSKTDPRFRELFVAAPGRKLVIADYAQIELRVAGLLAGDEALERIFRDGEDIHTATAARMFGCDLGAVTPNQRKAAKAVNFGILYGAQAPTIALNMGCTVPEAQGFIDAWFAAYPTLAQHREDFAQQALHDGYMLTAGKRRIDVHADARPTQLANYPVQASSFDVLARAMVHVDRDLDRLDLDASLAAVIHDEIILDTSREDARASGMVLVAGMKDGLLDVFPEAYTGDLVDAAVVNSWAQKP